MPEEVTEHNFVSMDNELTDDELIESMEMKTAFHQPLCSKPVLREGVLQDGGTASSEILIQQGDFMMKLDLKDAYYALPIHHSHRKYLRFVYQDRTYEFQCLPFGLSSAPRAFTKTLKPVLAVLWSMGIWVVIYIDDMLEQQSKVLQKIFAQVVDLLEKLGFLVKKEKCSPIPCQRLIFLGTALDSTTMTLSLPQPKLTSSVDTCHHLLAQGSRSVRTLSTLIGQMSHASQTGILVAPLHYREQCPSFSARDSNACFSQIFEEKTLGKLTSDEMNIFSSLRTFQSFCETCQKDVVLNSSILVNFVTRSALEKCKLNYNSWPQFVSSVQTQPGKLKCPDCETPTCEPVLTSAAHSKFVFIEFAPELMNVIKLYENISVGQAEYKLKGMVRSYNKHFTCAVFVQGKWTYIDDLCTSVKEFTSLAALTKQFKQGWFFTIYEVTNVVCESQSCKADNEHIEASMPAKKRKHLKSGVQAETPLNCSNHDNVLTVDNNVSQIKGSKSNFSKGNICSNKVGLEKF